MKPAKMKPPFRLSLRDLITMANSPLQAMKAPLQWSVQGAVSMTHYSLRKMRKPFYVSLLGVAAVTTTSFKKKMTPLSAATKDSYIVVVTKSKYEMKVFDSSGDWLVTYPVVFGSKDLGDKMMEGDRKTPEGKFHILGKRKHEKWNSFMLIDYPTQDSYKKFNDRKSRGQIPTSARIGGSIGIHGTWPNEDYAIDQYQNWTEGCISTKNKYVEEIFRLLPVGTTIEIRR